MRAIACMEKHYRARMRAQSRAHKRNRTQVGELREEATLWRRRGEARMKMKLQIGAVRLLIECFSRNDINACAFNDKRRYHRYALTKIYVGEARDLDNV